MSKPVGRLIMCTVCLTDADVIELPAPFIDPTLYVCQWCLRGDLLEAEQLTLVERVDRRSYDPAISEIPL